MKRQTIVFLVVIGIAFLIRLFHFSEGNEFMGDQGRAGIVAMEAVRTRTLPLAGPTTLRFQHLGPFFYYLAILFFGVSHFNPIVPNFTTILFGVGTVALIFLICRRLFGTWVGISLSLLWALAPEIIAFDLTFWEPHLLPFFAFLYLYALLRIVLDKHIRLGGILLGVSVNLLIQLHYFSVFFIGLTIVVALATLLVKDRTFSLSKREVSGAIFFALVPFFLLAVPFVIYEVQHNWRDLIEIVGLIVQSKEHTPLRRVLSDTLDYGGRMIGLLLPFGGNAVARQRMIGFFLVLTGVSLFAFRSIFRKQRMVGAILLLALFWFGSGTLAMGLYRDVVYNHYLFFLLPSIVLLLGVLLTGLTALAGYLPAVTIVVLLVTFQLYRMEQVLPEHNDIPRIQELSATVLADANNAPFAFTLLNTRSYSDLHFRFFFRKAGTIPKRMSEQQFEKLYLICEGTGCPKYPLPITPILCDEPYCSGDYGVIDLARWKLESVIPKETGKIFVYVRPDNLNEN